MEVERRSNYKGIEPDSDTIVFLGFPDLFSAYAIEQKHNTVVLHHKPAHFPKKTADLFSCRVAECQQVHVARGAMRFFRPNTEQHCTLEHESVPVRRTTQPVEQAFKRVVGECDNEISAAFARQIE